MRYVVLGASAAGISGVRELRRRCPEAEIVLVSKDDCIYSRCILHHYLAGTRNKRALCFAELDFEEKYRVDWKKGVSCVGLDVVELADHLLAKQLDRRGASTYEKALEEQGIRLHLGKGIRQVTCGSDGMVSSLMLTDKTRIPCTMLVAAAGVRPNVEFLENSGVELDRQGLIIDSRGRTNVPDVYGAGDVTGRSPIWPAAVKQGITAASNMAGADMDLDDFFASKSTMNFLGIPTMSLGTPQAPDDSWCQVVEDTGEEYRKIIHKNGRIHGAVLQGDLSYGGVLTQLIARKIEISRVKKPLFKIDYSDFFHEKDNFEFYYDEVKS